MPYALPELPYPYDALEPHIDEETMRVHHTKHHQTYTDKLNAALEGTGLEGTNIEALLADLDRVPEAKRTAVRNNGGGFLNHGIFWTTMRGIGPAVEPSGPLVDAINETWGSLDAFKKAFGEAAANQFGSGWAWLELTADGKLQVHGHPNQDNPVMHGARPILGLDVWEHAYYLKYQNRRPEYVAAWWNVVNWDEADRRYRSYRAQ